MKPLKKVRIIIDRDKHFGDLLIFERQKDSSRSLKLSFKTKIGSIKMWGEHNGTLKDFDFSKPISEKKITLGESLDISYHFQNRKLELKREISGGSTERNLYDVIHPIDRNLFSVILRNKNELKKVDPCSDDLILNKDEIGDQIAMVFSFVGLNGKPFMDKNIEKDSIDVKKSKQVIFLLENMNPSKIYIYSYNKRF